jgi:glucose dehydrogenase
VFVTGSSDFRYTTVAYDSATGAQLWVATEPAPGGYSTTSSLGLSPDGTRVFVTGKIQTSQTESEATTIAYEATTGRRLWLARYSAMGNDVNGGSDLTVSPDGATV